MRFSQKKNTFLILPIFFCFLFQHLYIEAQIYPVNVTTIMPPPYTAHLSDYYSLGSDKLTVNLLFQDYNELSIDVFLRLTIESTQLKIQTKNEFIPTNPITLTPGIIHSVSSTDLAHYFNYDNLNFSGIDKSVIIQNGKLPEGFYSFTFEAFEYYSGKKISNTSLFYANIITVDPPIIQSPACEKSVNIQDPQNLFFQWQLTNVTSPTIEYQLTMYEVTTPGIDPKAAVSNNQVVQIFQSDFDPMNSFLYDAQYTGLEAGKKYVFQVQARDMDDKISFNNNGISELCWFSYGYSTDGKIVLNNPVNDKTFKKTDDRYFQWESPNNKDASQAVTYYFKIVQLSEGQDPGEVITTNAAWYEETTQPVFAQSPWSLMLQKPFDKDQKYAWQVVASTGEQEVAKSDVYTFKGPPLIEKFFVDNIEVEIVSLENKDLNNLSGKGRFKINPDGSKITMDFKNLKIMDNAGRFVLASGNISGEVDLGKFEFKPQYEPNGSAYFYPDSVRLNKAQGLQIGGIIKWDLPHAVTTSKKGEVISNHIWFLYNDYEYNGSAALNDVNDFNLLEPINFRLKLLTKSDFLITKNKFKLRFYGHLYLPSNIIGVKSKQVIVTFDNVNDLYYLTNGYIKDEDNILILTNTKYYIDPQKITIDLSSVKSPLKKSENNDWRGVYFDDYNVIYNTDFDDSKQIIFYEKITHNFKLLTSNTNKCWITSQGLQFFLDHQYTEITEIVTFNQFPSKLTSLKLNITNNNVSESKLKGTIKIPIINEDNDYSYTVPIANDGFKEGYLDNTLDGLQFTFNPEGGEQLINITIIRAVFADNERLDMSLNLDWPFFDAKLNAVSDFRAYGNYYIGFTEANGFRELDQQVNARLRGYPINITGVGAAWLYDKYVFVVQTEVTIADEITGENGGPAISSVFSSMTTSITNEDDLTLDNENEENTPTTTTSQDPIFDGFPYLGGKSTSSYDNDKVHIDTIEVSFNFVIFSATGKLIIIENDPMFGTSWQGFLKGNILVPVSVNASAIYVSGRNTADGDYPFWFFQVGIGINEVGNTKSHAEGGKPWDKTRSNAKVKKGKLNKLFTNGVPIPPINTAISGAWIRVYHHMNHISIIEDISGKDLEKEHNEALGLDNNEENESENWKDALPNFDIISDQVDNFDYRPHKETTYGGFLQMNIGDIATNGYMWQAECAGELAFMTNGWNLILQANVYYLNFNIPVLIDASVLKGTGVIAYNSPTKHFFARVDVTSETPVLCASGTLVMDFSPGKYLIQLGSRGDRIKIVPSCFGISPTGWLRIKNDSVIVAAGMAVSAELQLPKINIGVASVKGYAGAELAVTYEVKMTTNPWGFNQFSQYLDGFANVSLKYVIGTCPFCNKGTLTFIDARLSGDWIFNFKDGYYEGKLSGRFTVCGKSSKFSFGPDRLYF